MTVWPAFPADYTGAARNGVAMKIVDGSLRIRSRWPASGYVDGGQPLADAAGFVDTGDIVERHGDRFYFAGRKGGIINIGGLKVHPEEIEAVINRHPSVRMSLVHGKRNPITGSIVVADVVLKAEAQGGTNRAAQIELQDDILKLCRDVLPRAQGAGGNQLRAGAQGRGDRQAAAPARLSSMAATKGKKARSVLVTGGSRGLGPCHRAKARGRRLSHHRRGADQEQRDHRGDRASRARRQGRAAFRAVRSRRDR